MCIYAQDMKFLWSNLWLGWLSTDDETMQDNNDATRRTIHDCIGSVGKWANKLLVKAFISLHNMNAGQGIHIM